MRVVVAGGCTFADTRWLHAGLDLLHSKAPIAEIIEGGEPGADVRAQEWANRNGVRVTTVEAQWERHSAGLKAHQENPAGAIRYIEMARLRPDVVLVCPGASAHMTAAALTHGLRLIYLEKMPVLPTPKGAGVEPAPQAARAA